MKKIKTGFEKEPKGYSLYDRLEGHLASNGQIRYKNTQSQCWFTSQGLDPRPIKEQEIEKQTNEFFKQHAKNKIWNKKSKPKRKGAIAKPASNCKIYKPTDCELRDSHPPLPD